MSNYYYVQKYRALKRKREDSSTEYSSCSTDGIWETTPSSSLSSNKIIASSNSVEVSVNNIVDSVFGHTNESELNLIRNDECHNSLDNDFGGAFPSKNLSKNFTHPHKTKKLRMESTTSHAVMKFIDELNDDGEKLLDFVPVTWSKKTNTINFENDFKKENYEQGMRHLNRIHADSNIESTNKENLPKHPTIIEKITSNDACVILEGMKTRNNRKRNKSAYSLSDSSDDSMHLLKSKNLKKRRKRALAKIDYLSSEAEESSFVLPRIQKNKEKYEATLAAVKALIEKSEKNILNAVASVKKSLQHNFNKKIDHLVNNLNINYGLANIHTMDPMNDATKLEISIPITNMDDFIAFDSNLKENQEKLDIVKKFILMKVKSAGHFKKAIGSVMSAIMNKDVQLKYSAKGKIINGNGKKNFSSTNLFKIIEEGSSVMIYVSLLIREYALGRTKKTGLR
ncbi:hypothetical protein PV327_005052 [Microctonus hyperodae]|uniref:DUF4806 domain-containing protein n=1 Tax=Microctonus hyperodae TaxID=165561 RepID=A0AA39G0L4_MICHY|nr:hypothetical protein PV327_005052 [Microctonus hyperodae]